MKKKPKDKKTHASSWVDSVAEDYEFAAMNTNDVLTEDPEFPAIISNKSDSTSTFTDAERKKEEMKNSTIGGF